VASNRLGAIFNISNPDASNSTAIMSDSIVTFKPTKDGKLEFLDLSPSGGISPRHFSLNQDGSMIAIANQMTKNIVVYSRDLQSGKMGQQIASASNLGFGDLTNVQWLAG
jgi:6-phosphogluconolactonase (cycloisomerase 2 family)